MAAYQWEGPMIALYAVVMILIMVWVGLRDQ